MNWDCAESRAALIERVGVKEYNRLHSERVQSLPAIYRVQTMFGNLYAVKGTKMAYYTLAEAEKHLASLK